MKINIPTPLRSYSGGSAQVSLSAPTLGALLRELDARFPGMRFRIIDEQDGIRPHIKLFVNTELVGDLNRSLAERDEVHIICALSGG